jgi:dephospho-CoA kinase
MLKLGITGGIGSGKTTACLLFELWGIPVYYADVRAKELMTEDPVLRKGLIRTFGQQVFNPNNSLNRPYLSSLVFGNENLLQQLNALVHPAVERDYSRWHAKQKNTLYTLKEAALLFESGSYRQLDAVITVTAPREVRIKRTIARDNTTREAVLNRMQHQLSEEERIHRAQFILRNNEEQSIIEQVERLHQKLCNKKTD